MGGHVVHTEQIDHNIGVIISRYWYHVEPSDLLLPLRLLNIES